LINNKGRRMGNNTESVKISLSPLVVCSSNFYLHIPLSYFAVSVLTKNQHKNPCTPCLIREF
jgi:hypothetical protein